MAQLFKEQATKIYIGLVVILIISLNALLSGYTLKSNVTCESRYSQSVTEVQTKNYVIFREAYTAQKDLNKSVFDLIVESASRPATDPPPDPTAGLQSFLNIYTQYFAQLEEFDREFEANQVPEKPEC